MSQYATVTGGLSVRREFGGTLDNELASATQNVVTEHCGLYFPDSEDSWRATEVAYGWAGVSVDSSRLIDEQGNPIEPTSDPGVDRLLALPAAEQKAWMGRYLAAAAACDDAALAELMADLR